MAEEEDSKPTEKPIDLAEMIEVMRDVIQSREIANKAHNRTDPKNRWVRDVKVLDRIHDTLTILAMNEGASREFLRNQIKNRR